MVLQALVWSQLFRYHIVLELMLHMLVDFFLRISALKTREPPFFFLYKLMLQQKASPISLHTHEICIANFVLRYILRKTCLI